MDDEQVREALFTAFDSDRGDRAALGALADWYEEHGEIDAAACLHWALALGRRPGFNERQQVYGQYFWVRQDEHPILDDPQAQLPEMLWEQLTDFDEPHSVASFKSYRSARAAFTALLAAWKAGKPVEHPPSSR
jgi:hypothetical protein